MMQPFTQRLCSGRPLVADGAMGTMLFERGLEPGQCPEAVNLSNASLLEEIAAAYFAAGAEILETNTFGGSPLKLARYGLEEQTEAINRAAVGAVQKAVAGRAYVAASCGPCGRLLEPYGDTKPETVYQSFRRQIQCLVAEGVDCICVETMTDLAEAKLAVSAAKDVSAEIPVLATMTFDATPRGFFTIMGVSVGAAASALQEAGADAVGSNCGNGVENLIEVARVFRSSTDLPLVIQPNAGVPETREGRTHYTNGPALMGEKARALLDLGVRVIGGCCGTTPEHIRAIRATVDSFGGL
jgi:5-methyltetrahydrofolate--homocysteine methyltransferase